MSLKARLILLNTALLGGFIILFGVVVYVLASFTLIRQVDHSLAQTATDVIEVTHINASGDLQVLAELSLADNVVVQAWGPDARLLGYSGNIAQLRRPMDPMGLQTMGPVFRDVELMDVHLRVFSVPLKAGPRIIGTLQVGMNMEVVDGTRSELVRLVIVASIVAVLMAAIAGFFMTRSIIAPLEAVTQSALEITQASDLSRRIPLTSNPQDEVGRLVQSFNLNLSRLERMIETQRRFMADVGHELRTPLTVIKGNVALMRRFGEVDDESLTSIVSEVDRLTRLVEDLLLLAQAEAGKLPMAVDIVELDTLLFEVMQTAQVLARDKIKLVIGDMDQVQVCGDRDRLKQVFLNLVSNGIKYTPKGGQVRISLSKDAENCCVKIFDSGAGIPKEDLPHIFERFYRGEKSRTRAKDGQGFGLGLSIVYWIVRNHDGHIDVQSEMGQGTTFSVSLPLSNAKKCKEMAILLSEI